MTGLDGIPLFSVTMTANLISYRVCAWRRRCVTDVHVQVQEKSYNLVYVKLSSLNERFINTKNHYCPYFVE